MYFALYHLDNYLLSWGLNSTSIEDLLECFRCYLIDCALDEDRSNFAYFADYEELEWELEALNFIIQASLQPITHNKILDYEE